MAETPNVQALNKALLSQLVDQCKLQIQDFKEGKSSTDSSSCAEIVRHAASGNSEALGLLLNEISKPIIMSRCPQGLRGEIDEFVQQVNERLIRKFLSTNSPFRALSFQAYHSYLNATIQSVISNWARQKRPVSLLDGGHKNQKTEPATSPTTNKVEREEIFEKLLALLPDPLEQEVLMRRIALDESPNEIVESLKLVGKSVTKQEVFRLTEKALRHLRKNYKTQQIIADLRDG